MNTTNRIKSFKEFYPFYLEQHQNYTSRVLHFVGTSCFIVSLIGGFLFHQISFLGVGVFLAYACAWVGHFFFEKNKPATFQYPIFSLLSDFKLYFEILAGNQKLRS
jgi:hypothetical protein